jgi:hypothetical protein
VLAAGGCAPVLCPAELLCAIRNMQLARMTVRINKVAFIGPPCDPVTKQRMQRKGHFSHSAKCNSVILRSELRASYADVLHCVGRNCTAYTSRVCTRVLMVACFHDAMTLRMPGE